MKKVLYIDHFPLRSEKLTKHLNTLGVNVSSLLLQYGQAEEMRDVSKEIHYYRTDASLPENIRSDTLARIYETIQSNRQFALKFQVMPFIESNGGLDDAVLVSDLNTAQYLDWPQGLPQKISYIMLYCRNAITAIRHLHETMRLGIMSSFQGAVPFNHDGEYHMEKAAELITKVVSGETLSQDDYLYIETPLPPAKVETVSPSILCISDEQKLSQRLVHPPHPTENF